MYYTLLPLHRAFHVARAWPNSKYEDINEILYQPSIVPGGGAEQVWEGSAPHKTHHWEYVDTCLGACIMNFVRPCLKKGNHVSYHAISI